MFDVRSSARRRRLPPCSDILRLALTDHFDAIALMSSGCISWTRRNRTSGSLRASPGHRGQKRALFPKPERTGSGFGISTAATAVPARAMNSCLALLCGGKPKPASAAKATYFPRRDAEEWREGRRGVFNSPGQSPGSFRRCIGTHRQ